MALFLMDRIAQTTQRTPTPMTAAKPTAKKPMR
jgi:hypothetical protein